VYLAVYLKIVEPLLLAKARLLVINVYLPVYLIMCI
jgi:hypothetical protein